MNIHPRYPSAQEFTVSAKVKHHPMVQHNMNCYCYQFLLMTWNDSNEPPTFERQYSEWIYPKKLKPEFDFSFKRDEGVVHWMLFAMKQMGWNDELISLKQQGMRIAEVGPFIEGEVAMLEEYIAEQKRKLATEVRRKKKEIKRVPPKGST